MYTEQMIRDMIADAIKGERIRMAEAIQNVALPMTMDEAGFNRPSPGFEDFRDDLAMAIWPKE
jgi:hypothetical protein